MAGILKEESAVLGSSDCRITAPVAILPTSTSSSYHKFASTHQQNTRISLQAVGQKKKGIESYKHGVFVILQAEDVVRRALQEAPIIL